MFSPTTITNRLQTKAMQNKLFPKSHKASLIALLLRQFPLQRGFIMIRLQQGAVNNNSLNITSSCQLPQTCNLCVYASNQRRGLVLTKKLMLQQFHFSHLYESTSERFFLFIHWLLLFNLCQQMMHSVEFWSVLAFSN